MNKFHFKSIFYHRSGHPSGQVGVRQTGLPVMCGIHKDDGTKYRHFAKQHAKLVIHPTCEVGGGKLPIVQKPSCHIFVSYFRGFQMPTILHIFESLLLNLPWVSEVFGFASSSFAPSMRRSKTSSEKTSGTQGILIGLSYKFGRVLLRDGIHSLNVI